jgi:hypothetical protein
VLAAAENGSAPEAPTEMKKCHWIQIFTAGALLASAAAITAQSPAFADATIRRSGDEVQFEKDGSVEVAPGMVDLRDVTLSHCIRWAYHVQDAQVAGSEALRDQRYDI